MKRQERKSLRNKKWGLKWYKEVPDRKHKVWTEAEKRIIWTLRDSGMSVQEIKNIVDTSNTLPKTALYNQIRMERAAIKGKCVKCRKHLTKEDIKACSTKKRHRFCLKCKRAISKYKANRRRDLLEAGRCVSCGNVREAKNRTTCNKCTSTTYRRRIMSGVCGNCGKLPINENSTSLCWVCLKKNFNFTKEYNKAIIYGVAEKKSKKKKVKTYEKANC